MHSKIEEEKNSQFNLQKEWENLNPFKKKTEQMEIYK